MISLGGLVVRADATGQRGTRACDTARLPRAVYEGTEPWLQCLRLSPAGARDRRRHRPDLIYERHAPNTCCGVLAGRRFGVPLLLEINAPWHDHLPDPARRPFEPETCPPAGTVGVLKQHPHDRGERRSEAASGRKSGVPERAGDGACTMPSIPARFHSGVSGAEVRRRYRLDGEVVAGFVGWLRDWHGLEGVIDAVRWLRSSGARTSSPDRRLRTILRGACRRGSEASALATG